jgi:hypothetical protein
MSLDIVNVEKVQTVERFKGDVTINGHLFENIQVECLTDGPRVTWSFCAIPYPGWTEDVPVLAVLMGMAHQAEHK